MRFVKILVFCALSVLMVSCSIESSPDGAQTPIQSSALSPGALSA